MKLASVRLLTGVTFSVIAMVTGCATVTNDDFSVGKVLLIVVDSNVVVVLGVVVVVVVVVLVVVLYFQPGEGVAERSSSQGGRGLGVEVDTGTGLQV